MIRPAGYSEKRTGEKHPYGFRYRDPDIPVGATIVSVTAVAAPAGLTIGDGQFEGNTVFVWAEGGSAGVDYTINLKTILSTGAKLEDDYVLKVR